MYHVELKAANGQTYGWDGDLKTVGEAITTALSGLPGSEVLWTRKGKEISSARDKMKAATEAEGKKAEEANEATQAKAKEAAEAKAKEASEKAAADAKKATDAAEKQAAEDAKPKGDGSA